LLQFCLFVRTQPTRTAGRSTIIKPFDPLAIVPDYRVTQRLPVHADQPGRFSPLQAIKGMRDGKKAQDHSTIRFSTSQRPQFIRTQILSDR
jgi:hypothetical protein